ncbi:DUF397 domain-containing protein [Streptomyces sp. NPDC002643]
MLPWQKSTYCGDASNCLYIAAPTRAEIHLRESDAPGTVITTTPPTLATLIRTLRTAHPSR